MAEKILKSRADSAKTLSSASLQTSPLKATFAFIAGSPKPKPETSTNDRNAVVVVQRHVLTKPNHSHSATRNGAYIAGSTKVSNSNSNTASRSRGTLLKMPVAIPIKAPSTAARHTSITSSATTAKGTAIRASTKGIAIKASSKGIAISVPGIPQKSTFASIAGSRNFKKSKAIFIDDIQLPPPPPSSSSSRSLLKQSSPNQRKQSGCGSLSPSHRIQSVGGSLSPSHLKKQNKLQQLVTLSNLQLEFTEVSEGLLKLPLKDHQKQGLTWMKEKEKCLKGGILADEMGLGKTFLMIAFIAISPLVTLPGVSKTNLIVTPVSLIKPWIAEIKSKGVAGTTVCEYSARTVHATLTMFDYIVISYEMLSSTLQKRTSFFDISFQRVVLDEADKIRNSETKLARACYAVKSVYRWGITGTPIGNSVLDLYSTCKFLRVDPYQSLQYFETNIGTKSMIKSTNALQTLARDLILKRTKGLLVLPSLTIKNVAVAMTSFERSFYDYIVGVQGMDNRTKILRLKQTCNCVESVSGIDESFRNRLLIKHGFFAGKEPFDPDSLLLSQFSNMGIDSKLGNNRNSLDTDSLLLSQFTNLGITSQPSSKVYVSSKLLKLAEIIQSTPGKIIIFSQFVDMLRIIKSYLDTLQTCSILFIGEMNSGKRAAAISNFQHTNTKCMLASLKCAAVGLNLVMANTVIMFDLWWNPAVEDQAFARVHRLGQRKDVTVIRFVVQNSFEEVVVEINRRKRGIIEQAVGGVVEKGENDDEVEAFRTYLKSKQPF